jgi:hypothetical protein
MAGMQTSQKNNPLAQRSTTIKVVVNLIPRHLAATLSRTHVIDEQCRTFSEWTHVVSKGNGKTDTRDQVY